MTMADKQLHEFDAEIFAVGKWNGDEYTEQDLDIMVTAFAALGDAVKPPVKLGHNEQQLKEILQDGHPALGWVKTLRKVGSKLVATLTQVPDLVYQAIKAGRYKRVSSEIYWNYKRGDTTFSRVLAGVALLGADIPAVTSLADLEAYLTQSMQDASFDRVGAYSFEANEDGTITTSGGSTMADDTKIYQDKINDLSTQVKELTDKLAANDKVAEDAKTYKAELEAIRKERSDERKADKIKVFTDLCNQMVTDGKLPPATRDILCKFDEHTYSENAGFSVPLDTVEAMLKSFASVVLDTGEKGKKDADKQTEHKDSFEELNAKAKAYSAEKKVSYAMAVQAVLAEDTELAERYLNETQKAE